MRSCAFLLLALGACAPSTNLDDVEVVRQAALPRTPVATGGATGARLGTSVSACRYNGLATAQAFVAGVPGLRSARLFMPAPITFAPLDAGSEFGVSVLCTGSGNQPEIIAAGAPPNALRRTFLGTVDVLVTGARVDALARGDFNVSSPSLIATDAGLLTVATSSNPMLLRNDAAGVVRLACAHGTNICAVGHRGNGATIFEATTGQTLDTIDPPDAGRTISAIAIGELHPASGLEVAIAGDGVVDVYARGGRGRLLYTLRPPQPLATFGQALAVDNFDAGGGFSSLWVGSPGEARVYRFFGDGGGFADEMNAPIGTEFGRSLAVEHDTNLLVGAPFFDGLSIQEGAVFRDSPANWVTLGNITGVPQECDVNSPCRVSGSGMTCFDGTCFGGIVCAALTSTCAVGMDSGIVDPNDGGTDAGTNPADSGMTAFDSGVGDSGTGTIDASVAIDAGLGGDAGVDAGGDAGSVGPGDGGADGGSGKDAGPPGEPPTPNFTIMTCGCGSPALGPLALLGLFFFSRRRVWAKVRSSD